MASRKPRGKSTKHRSGEVPPPSPLRLAIIGALIVVTAGGITAIAITSGRGAGEQVAAPPPPEPWYYDTLKNQHWHPDHAHWHPGPPPPPGDRALGDGVEAPPDIPNPSPWQYDERTNRHYDPGHGHWHAGPPPAGVDENTLVSPVQSEMVDPPPGITNPTPWQYDEESNKHYHPGHAHWHSGPPPPEGDR